MRDLPSSKQTNKGQTISPPAVCGSSHRSSCNLHSKSSFILANQRETRNTPQRRHVLLSANHGQRGDWSEKQIDLSLTVFGCLMIPLGLDSCQPIYHSNWATVQNKEIGSTLIPWKSLEGCRKPRSFKRCSDGRTLLHRMVRSVPFAFEDSMIKYSFADHNTYRALLRSSSIQEPRYPPLGARNVHQKTLIPLLFFLCLLSLFKT
mmetsp:Transcript_17344/g.57441  ORF Transcript_17344/g.57441 Transcript_17344/m.57441 type:complete len:205 (+) Transcript_17344:3866-4480(+)